MSQEAPNHYVTQYMDQAIHAFQAQGHLFKGMFTEPARVTGDTVKWMTVGKGEASELQRGSRAAEMNASRGSLTKTLKDYQANDWVWETDISKMTVNEMAVVTKTAGMAIGRKSDLIKVDEMNAAPLTTVGDGTTGFTLVDALTACQQLQSKNVPWDGQVYCGLPSLAWNQFLSYKQVNNSDWVKDDLPYCKVTQAKMWNGVRWFLMPDEYAPVPASNKYDFFLWHKSAVGLATGYELRTNVTWENLFSGWYHNNRFSAAAKVLLPEGIIRLRYASNSAITLN